MGNVISPISILGTGMRVGWGLYLNNITNWKSKVDIKNWRVRIFGKQMQLFSDKLWGLQSRYGLGMNGSTRPIKSKSSRWGWCLFLRLNSPPNRKVWLQNIRESFIRCLLNNKNISTSRGTRYYEFYKTQSLKKIRKNNEIESDYRIRPEGK